jgi:hypothetical protein
MIVAPLMGPILGLAMGIVVGDARLFHSSLLAELSGVVVVILTAFLVAQVTGVSQIDFMASEIAPLFSIWPLAWPPGWPEPFVLSIPRCRPVLPGLLSRWPGSSIDRDRHYGGAGCTGSSPTGLLSARSCCSWPTLDHRIGSGPAFHSYGIWRAKSTTAVWSIRAVPPRPSAEGQLFRRYPKADRIPYWSRVPSENLRFKGVLLLCVRI